MGLFGGDEDDSAQQSADLMNQQIRQNQAELETKRQSLYKERLDIIKGQGEQQWIPDKSSGNAKKGQSPGWGGRFGM